MSGGPQTLLLQVAVILLGAKLGGEAAERLRQPAVLGELLVGILLGASLLGGFVEMPDFALAQDRDEVLAGLDGGEADPDTLAVGGLFFAHEWGALGSLDVLLALSALGVILLLFEVGLESDVRELAKVGRSSLLVAAIGILASFAAGYGFSALLSNLWGPWRAAGDALPDGLLHIFVGATLTATSVGITARVLADMGRLKTREARIILGAAVLDDVGGLLILSVVAGLVTAAEGGGALSALAVLRIAVLALGFLAALLILGHRLVPRAFDALSARFGVRGFPVALALAFALAMSYLASLAGLADIVGAFAAGLLLSRAKGAPGLFEGLRPVSSLLVGFFFVTLGMRADLTRMEGHGAAVLAIGVGLAALAVLSKLACGWGVLGRDRASRWVVGVGMAPRGEVGLIFAALGLSQGLIANWQYAALILVVLLTTFITPLWLHRLRGAFRDRPGGEGAGATKRMGEILEA